MEQSMDPGLWLRIKPLFEAALDLPPDDRDEFIEATASHEPLLAGTLRSMLQAHGESASLLDRSLPERMSGFMAVEQEQPLLAGGQRVGGRYRLASELGRGGNGVAWLARDEAVLGKPVVVKVLHSQTLGSSFDTELAALARLNHPLIASPLDSGALDDGRRFLVLEYIDGPTLREVLRGGPLEPMRACHFVRQIASALEAAHRQDVWHLDLKPENILIRDAGGPEEQPVLVDFGISRLAIAVAGEGSTGGSLAYASPEQLTGSPSTSSDQYSLARMAVEMITGHRPAPLEPASDLLVRCAALRHAVISVLARALSPYAESRYPDVSAFAAELFNALDPRLAIVKSRRLLAAAFCFLLVAVLVAYAWINREKEIAMLVKEAQITSSQVRIVHSLLQAGYLDQRILAETVRGAVERLKARVDAGQRHPDVLQTLFNSQMEHGLMHGHPGVPHLGSVDIGIRSVQDALVTLRLMYESKPKDERFATAKLWVWDTLASQLAEAGQIEQSAAVCDKALRKIEQWEAGKQYTLVFTQQRASLLMTFSRGAFHRKNWEECLRVRNEGVRLQRLAASGESDAGLMNGVAGVLAARGFLYREMGRLEEALADFAESDSILARTKVPRPRGPHPFVAHRQEPYGDSQDSPPAAPHRTGGGRIGRCRLPPPRLTEENPHAIPYQEVLRA